jgi:hypothetical protein
MKPVFADTFYWIALTNPKDSDHQRVIGFDRALGSRVIVTTYKFVSVEKLLADFKADVENAREEKI